MADTLAAFQRLVGELQKISPGVHGQCSPAWGGAEAHSRSRIRASLAQSLSGLTPEDQRALSDLSEPPRLENWSVSISHTARWGGWMAVPRPAQIGWDIEVTERIQNAVVERVCNANELQQAPQPAYLWPGKEALYKALEDEQPLVIGQLTLGAWRALSPELWAWQGFGPRNGQGLLVAGANCLLAACLVL